MKISSLFSKSPLSLSLARDREERPREGHQLDYVPFGIKTLKVEVTGDFNGKLLLAPANLSSVAGEKFAHEDGEGSCQFVVSWGGGHEDHYELNYPKKRVVYFLLHHIGEHPVECTLTIQARSSSTGELLASLPVALTYPTVQEVPWPIDELVRPVWEEATTGANGETDIRLRGTYAPDYISRWWPVNRVIYDAGGSPPPMIRLRFRRLAGPEGGDLTVHARRSETDPEVVLGRITGRIPSPLYDMKQVVPELYRFGPKSWALRIWFFWLDLDISVDDLRRCGTRTEEEVQQAWRELRSKAEGGTAERGWPQMHEIPDAERVDIVFSSDLEPLFAATDLHWREMWARHEQTGKPASVQIMNTRPAALVHDIQELRKVVDGWGTILLTRVLPRHRMEPPYNPALEVMRELKGEGKLAADPVAMESHTPAIMSGKVQIRFTSTDVTDG